MPANARANAGPLMDLRYVDSLPQIAHCRIDIVSQKDAKLILCGPLDPQNAAGFTDCFNAYKVGW